MKKSLLFIGLILMAITQSHAIEFGLPKNEFGFDGGGVSGVSGNDFKEILDKVGVFGVHYTRFITPRFGIGTQLDIFSGETNGYSSYYSYDPTFQITSSGYANFHSKLEDVSLMATGRVNMWTRGIVIPYFSTGLGLNRFSFKSSASAYGEVNFPDPLNPGSYIYVSSSDSASADESSIHLCGMLGLGADIMISEVFRIGIEGRYNYYKQSAIKDAGDLEMYMLKGKTSWYF